MCDNIQIPTNIDDYISKGIKKGKKKKSRRMIKRTSGACIFCILTFLLVGIRVSPVFAANAAKIPGLKYIVEIVRFDKGLTSAVENNYIQSINKSCEKQDINFTVKDIIADRFGIVVFYSVENKSGYKYPRISDPKLLDAKRSSLEMSSSYGFSHSDNMSYDGKIEFYFKNEDNRSNIIPDSVILQTSIEVDKTKALEEEAPTKYIDSSSAHVDNSEVLNSTWEVNIPIDKTKFSGMEKEYKIDQSVEIEGQKLFFKNIRIYPTRSILSVSFDKSNSKKILALEDLKLIDEKGQEWGRIADGMTGTSSDENSHELYFQSNYFQKPKELYLTGNSAMALDKKDCYFTVDTEKERITFSPYDLLSITDFNIKDNVLRFEVEINKKLGGRHYFLSNEALDANGNEIKIIESGSSNVENKSFCNYTLKLNDNFKGPIKFKINYYPSEIQGAFKVKIPLDN